MTMPTLSQWQAWWPWALALGMALIAWWGETRRIWAVRQWFQRGALERVGWRPVARKLTLVLGLLVVTAGALAVSHWQDEASGALWLMIDQSRSQATVGPGGVTRWQQAQPVLQGLVAAAKRPIGVIVFRNDATVLVPPTRDRQSVIQTLGALRPVLDRQGSDPAAALRLFERLRQSSDGALLVSDGEWASRPAPSSLPVVGWGLGSPGPVPAVPGDPATPLSRPNPAALHVLCRGNSLWGPAVTVADLTRLPAEAGDGGRREAGIFLLLALIEAAVVIGQRYQIRLGQLPYRWVQRWVLWRTGAAVMVLLLLPAASEAPAWRWAMQASPAREAYDAGCQAAARGDRQTAERAWRRAVALDPAWQPAWYNLGTLLADQPERRQEAIAALDQAIRLDATDVWARENRQALLTSGFDGRGPGKGAAPAAMPSVGVALPSSLDPSVLAKMPALDPSRPMEGRTIPLGQPQGRPLALPSLRPEEVDRLLGQAERLPPQALQRLKQRQGQTDVSGSLPSLSAEQWARLAALAARMGVQPEDLHRQGRQASPYVEPAAHPVTGLTW